ncbi:unnamed protein product [Cunninghamella blakesleeana]
MPISTDPKKKKNATGLSGMGTSPLNLPFPIDFETPERRKYQQYLEESKKKLTSDDLVAYKPSIHGIQSHIIWPNAIMKGYLIKHIPPTFSFTKNRKRRFVILADRYIYTFKHEEPNNKYRDVLELGPESQAFVTDHLSGVLYCIEIRKSTNDQHPWFLQAENAEAMKLWLDKIRKVIQFVVQYGKEKGPVQQDKLTQWIHPLSSTDESLVMLHGNSVEDGHSLHGSTTSSSSGSRSSMQSSSTPRSSHPEIDTSSWRNSDSTQYTDAPMSASSLSSSQYHPPYQYHSFISPPISPIRGSFSTTTSSAIQRNDSIRSSISQDDFYTTSRRSYSRLPDKLPPQLPPPVCSLPPPPTTTM